MTRQSISFTAPNDDWLKTRVESEEYKSKSEVVNDLIRKERERELEIEWIRAKLIEAEKSGFIEKTPGEILKDIKSKARRDGEL
jgi:antitoxin ParD1/3/4